MAQIRNIKIPKFNEGKIYMIRPSVPNADEKDIYIGSTTQKYLSTRRCQQIYSYEKWKINKIGKIASFNLFDKYGVNECKIVLLEKFPCTKKSELINREGYYIKNRMCVNVQVPGRTKKEYYACNRLKILEKAKVYRLMKKKD